MGRQLVVALVLWATVAASRAQSIAAPLGLEIGTATCKDAAAAAKVAINTDGVSPWAGGSILEISNPAVFGVQGLLKVLVVCGPDDKIRVIHMTFPKGGIGAENVRSTASQLDQKYRAIRRNLPTVGNAAAEWASPNATIELESPHLSFEFGLAYWAKGAKATYEKWRAERERGLEQKKAGAL